MTRDEVLLRLRAQVANQKLILGAGAGTGLSAKCAETGGADLIIIYNSGRFRMAGRGSLAGCMPYSDANAVVVQMADEVLSNVKEVPVLAGVCGTDPFRQMPRFLGLLRDMGFAGVQNFPTVGLIDGMFRRQLEETGMSFALEVEMIAAAHELDLLTCPYVFTRGDAEAMVRAGADILVVHLGLTSSGAVGARTTSPLADAVRTVQEIRDAAVAINERVIVLCHGGPLAYPADVRPMLEQTTGVAGFFGASSIERLPTEVGIIEAVREFKALPLNGRDGVAPSSVSDTSTVSHS